MWRYQWTGKNVAYTEELANVLYDESQGIIDIAVKLYAIVQIDAITNGTEEFSAPDIRKAAEKKLGLVKPMLEALRSGDKKRILKYEDIAPVNIEDYLSAYKAVKTEIQEKTTEQKLTVLEQTSIKLMEVEVDPVIARRLAGKVLASHKTPISVGEAFKEAYRLYIAEDTSGPVEDVLGDIRNNDGYAGFKQSGAIDDMEW